MIRALLLDLDGTLYDQGKLRRRMLFDLSRSFIAAPLRGYRTARALRAFRQAQETLRLAGVCGDIGALQSEMACLRTGFDARFVAACVHEWMEQAPLRHLAACMVPGVKELLEFARRAGIRVALCSDYPAARKLESMGLAKYFDEVICAQDPEVASLKPHPGILRIALQRLGVAASEAVYAGDRPDVDGATATAAGIAYINIVHRAAPGSSTIGNLPAKIRSWV
ncbi:MAG: HAD-IA family hydrolase [Acidobacteriota bacterium]|nr:HAD-IA family hydrolase [Acidobacteriota bacterium]